MLNLQWPHLRMIRYLIMRFFQRLCLPMRGRTEAKVVVSFLRIEIRERDH